MIASAAVRSRWWTASGSVWTGRDDDRIAGVDAQRVDVLHRADRDARVVGVAHDLVLDLLPADEAALDHDLADRARAQAGADPLAIGRLGLDDAAAGATEREGGPDDRRQADRRERRVGRAVALRLGRALDDRARGVRLPDPVEQVAERSRSSAIWIASSGVPSSRIGVSLEDAGVGQLHGQVERGLAAQAGQQAVGPLPGDDRLDRLDGQRLEIDRRRRPRVGHDRGRVGVEEDRADALLAQRPARLGARRSRTRPPGR